MVVALTLQEQEAISAHFQELKSQMTKFREEQKKRLLELTRDSSAAIKSLEAKLKTVNISNLSVLKQQAEKILYVAEMTHSLKTEQELVNPFDIPTPEKSTLSKVR